MAWWRCGPGRQTDLLKGILTTKKKMSLQEVDCYVQGEELNLALVHSSLQLVNKEWSVMWQCLAKSGTYLKVAGKCCYRHNVVAGLLRLLTWRWQKFAGHFPTVRAPKTLIQTMDDDASWNNNDKIIIGRLLLSLGNDDAPKKIDIWLWRLKFSARLRYRRWTRPEFINNDCMTYMSYIDKVTSSETKAEGQMSLQNHGCCHRWWKVTDH